MRLTSRRRTRGAVAASIAPLLLGGVSLPCAAQSPTSRGTTGAGITLDELLELQRRNVSTRRILRSAAEFCLGFNLTDAALRALREAGGDHQLITGLRSVCSVAPPEPLPGTLLDVDFQRDSSFGGFIAPDRQCSARFTPDGMQFENRRTRTGCIVSLPTDSLPSTVSLELTILGLGRRVSASAIFGFGRVAVTPEYYGVEIGADRRMALCRYARGSCERVVFEPLVAAIRSHADSVNRLVVTVRGREIEMRVNDDVAARYTAPAPVSGRLLLGVGPATTVVFTRLFVRDVTVEATTAQAPPAGGASRSP